MKRSTLLLFLLVIICAAAYWLISRKPWRTALREADYIAINDTSSVTKIFIANKNGEKILLERKLNNIWVVNEKTAVDVTKINMLLGTLHDMRIQKPLPSSMHNTVVGILASKGLKVEIYNADKIIKTIYVGTETPEQTGTFMLLEGDDQIYDVHIPGFVGYLTPRFIMNEIKWYSKFVFDENENSISMLKVTYPAKPEESFLYNKSIFMLKKSLSDWHGNLVEADSQFVKFYLSGYKNLYVEGYYEESILTQHAKDSLLKLQPFCEIKLINLSGETKSLIVYNKPISERSKQQVDQYGNALQTDPEKYFAIVNKRPNVASIQDFNFGRLFKKLANFRRKK